MIVRRAVGPLHLGLTNVEGGISEIRSFGPIHSVCRRESTQRFVVCTVLISIESRTWPRVVRRHVSAFVGGLPCWLPWKGWKWIVGGAGCPVSSRGARPSSVGRTPNAFLPSSGISAWPIALESKLKTEVGNQTPTTHQHQQASACLSDRVFRLP